MCIDISACIDQVFDRIDMTFDSRIMKRSSAQAIVKRIYRYSFF